MDGKSRLGRAVILGGLVVAVLAGCVEGTVTSNTNPKGEANKSCKLTIKVVNRDGGEESKTFEQDNATCKRCQVGAAFPACKKERSNDPPRIQNRSPEPAQNAGELASVTVELTSTHPGIAATILIYGFNGKVRDQILINEKTRDVSRRVPVLLNKDDKITVAARGSHDAATLSCRMLIARRQIAYEVAVYQVYCNAGLTRAEGEK